MQSPVCPLCGSQDNEIRFSVRGYDVTSCQVCELLFINPYPPMDEVHERVSDYKYDDLEIIPPEKHYSASIHFYNRYFPLIDQECRNAKSILEIGCGTGHLLELLGKKTNLYRVGIEPNARRAEFARGAANCEIYQGPLEKFASDRKFDVIVMINVFSHMSSFDALFTKIDSLLCDDGKLILKTGECTRNVRKNSVYDWGIPDHLHFLGMNTLQFICEKYDFKVLRHDRVPLSHGLFSPSRWKTPGRSGVRDIIKQVVVLTPFALPILAKLYDRRYGGSVFHSFIVLTR